MKNQFKAFLFFICGVFLSSCASWQAVKVAPGLNADSEIIMKPELQNLISGKKQNIKIVLRVPGAPKNITQETQKEVSRQYDRFERDLSKVGFVVRDRELLEKIAGESKPGSYLELAKAIDTDLILEILYLGPCDLSHKKYYDPKAGRMLELNNPSQELKHPGSMSFPLHGGQLDCRVITVRDGTVSGMFTIYNLPCDGLCDFEVLKGKEWRNPEPNPGELKGYTVGTDEQNIRQLASILMQTINEGEIVVSKIQQGSLASKNGLLANDVIEKINGQTVYNLSQAVDLIIKNDGKLEILLKRDDREMTVTFAKKFAEPIGAQLVYRQKVSAKPTETQAAPEAILPPPPPPVPAPVLKLEPAPAPAAPKDANISGAAPVKAAPKGKKQSKVK